MNTQKTAAEETLGFALPTRKVESFHYTDLQALLRDLPGDVVSGETTQDYTPLVETHLVSFKDGSLTGEQVLPNGVMMSANATKITSEDRDDAIVAMNAVTPGDAVEFVINGNSTV